MFTLIRFQNEGSLRDRGVHEFDAWASTFGDTRTELELQPSGTYKPVERFSQFVNVPELIDMFRSVADVVLKDDLRGYLRLPSIKGGRRQLITADASDAFRDYQKDLAGRIDEIEKRTRRTEKGDDILLKVITDGRHAAIDMRLVEAWNDNEPDNKLNKLIANAYRIWEETSEQRYRQRDGSAFPIPGAAQMIFSDLGTISAEETSGLLGLSLDQERVDPARCARRPRSPSCRTSNARPRSSACSTTSTPAACAFVLGSYADDGHRRQRPAAAEGAAPSRRAVAALRHRTARGPHRAAGQPARRD